MDKKVAVLQCEVRAEAGSFVLDFGQGIVIPIAAPAIPQKDFRVKLAVMCAKSIEAVTPKPEPVVEPKPE